MATAVDERATDGVHAPVLQMPSGLILVIVLLATFATGAFTVFFQLGTSKSLGSHEGYAIVPAREMLRTGDYVVPRFGGLPRLEKPPLSYWLIAGTAQITGELNVASARLPAAFSAVILAGLITVWATHWYGTAGGIAAAAAQLSSVYVLNFARKAEIDMTLALLITVALACIATHRVAESRQLTFFRWFGLWMCASVAWLGKFHFGPAMIIVPVVAWLIFERRWQMLRGLLNPAGILLFAAAAVIWPMLILDRLPQAWDIWRTETVDRALGGLGQQPPWFYIPHIIGWTLPWTIFAVLAWPSSWAAAFPGMRIGPFHKSTNDVSGVLQRFDFGWQCLVARGDSRERYLWFWVLATLAIITLSANKHPNYLLPALPAFSLWTARQFRSLHERWNTGVPILSSSTAMVVTVTAVCCVAAATAVWIFRPDTLVSSVCLVFALSFGGIAVAVWGFYVRRFCVGAFIVLGTWAAVYGIVVDQIIPAFDHRRGAYRFAEEVRETLGTTTPLGLYGMGQDGLGWYLGEPFYRHETTQQVVAHLGFSEKLLVLTTRDRTRELSAIADLTIIGHMRDVPAMPVTKLRHYRDLVLVELRGPDRSQ